MAAVETVAPEVQEQPDSEASPTTKQEMWAWYMYDWANSPYYQVYIVGIFPVFVKWLAEAYAARDLGFEDAQIFNCTTSTGSVDPAVMRLPGLGITAGSFPVAVGWITTVIQMIFLLSFSALGDYGPYRKVLLKRLTWVACGCIFINVFCITPELYWLAGLLRIVAGACFVLCVSYYNAYLPVLMEAYPDVTTLSDRIRLTDNASAKGNLAGYAGGVLMLTMSWVMHMVAECDPCGQSVDSLEANQIQSSQIEASRIGGNLAQSGDSDLANLKTCSPSDIFWVPAFCIGSVGIWWLSFSAYTFWRLQERPGKPLPTDTRMSTLGWKDVAETFKTILKYRETLLFVVVYFISSDALATLCGNAFLIMEEEASATSGQWTTMTSLHMNFILGALAAFLGIFLYSGVQNYFHISNRHMLLFQFILMTIVAIVCLSGGLRSIGFIPVMAPVSLTIGSMQSLTRSVFSNLIPPGKEASMFAFYEITDKGSNLIGAAVTLAIHNWSHSYVPSMWYIMLGFGASACVLCFVDVEKGMRDIGKGDAEPGDNESGQAADVIWKEAVKVDESDVVCRE